MQHDAAGVLTTWVNEFNAGNVDAIASLYSPDATLFGPFMREFGIGIGVRRTEGKVVDVERDSATGDVSNVHCSP